MLKIDLYDVLGIDRGASTEQVNMAYRQKAKSMHPDGGGSKADFEMLTMARDVLMDRDRRSHYDQTGKFDQSTPDNKRSEGLGRLAAAISNAVEIARTRSPNPFSLDIMTLAKNNMLDHRAEVEKQLENFSSKLSFYTDLNSRFLRDLGFDGDPIGVVLRGALNQIEKAISDCENEIAATNTALEMFEGYSFKKDEPKPTNFSFWDELAKNLLFDSDNQSADQAVTSKD